LDAIMLQPGWVRGTTTPVVTLERVVDNIEHICQLAGDARHVGIGSDLDGGYGSEQTPADLDTIADLAQLPALLHQRGYGDADVQAIMHGNWLRFFDEVLPAAPEMSGNGHRDRGVATAARQPAVPANRPENKTSCLSGTDVW